MKVYTKKELQEIAQKNVNDFTKQIVKECLESANQGKFRFLKSFEIDFNKSKESSDILKCSDYLKSFGFHSQVNVYRGKNYVELVVNWSSIKSQDFSESLVVIEK